jgi:ribosome-binding factor A
MSADKFSEEYWQAIDRAADTPVQRRSQASRRGGRSGPHRKALQLCGQVAETLNYVLSGECDDDVLRNLYVVRVDPAPDVSQVMVTVAPLDPKDAGRVDLIMTHLMHAAGKLRAEVASSIHRRKTPQLLFRVISPPSAAAEAKES